MEPGNEVFAIIKTSNLQKSTLHSGERNMPIYLLDDSLAVDIYYECDDSEFEDNICISIYEDCPEAEKIFRVGLTNIYLTRQQARQVAEALLKAAEASCNDPAEMLK